MSLWRHVRAIGLLPFMATIVVPALILWRTDVKVGWGAVAGVPLIGVGTVLFVQTVRLFASVGEGDARALGPHLAARGARAVPARPQPDDQRRGLRAPGRGGDLPVARPADLVRGVRRCQRDLHAARGGAGPAPPLLARSTSATAATCRAGCRGCGPGTRLGEERRQDALAHGLLERLPAVGSQQLGGALAVGAVPEREGVADACGEGARLRSPATRFGSSSRARVSAS